ncbi:hypothetical protein CathTA2_0039 [Caldalkalibacillus thermarum TA2.A1]|uniref:Uncharacterized protein n=1 Tax=Caldalkalibacillus thermarum (strain TA2.A1) TaxID=986075 RepID=F5LB51_CALTT|nr:hypothetical protein [Caldalkalibacillus thermarum]EGL81432.1 hypothetical protein CathTA2_0039 [Caldalkalibacillus thermarum TA2.A1]QZT34483.1 hypothetical protein HUR95_03605 [Caldalkalibacillus thermarum TA2.A1]
MSEECSFFSATDEKGYELLQKKLLSLSSQVQRHLIEIENSLNVLSFAIIPKKTYEQHTENKAKRNYWNATVIGGLGVLTGGLGLIAASGLIGLSTYFENKEYKAVKQLRDENEQYKIDFYIGRALDSFYHLMNTMLPYYVSQASKAYYSVAKH